MSPPPLLRAVKVSAFSGRYILDSSRCEDGAVLGRCLEGVGGWGGVQACEEFPAKFQRLASFDYEVCFPPSDKN